jgi:hypothetical protein
MRDQDVRQRAILLQQHGLLHQRTYMLREWCQLRLLYSGPDLRGREVPEEGVALGQR